MLLPLADWKTALRAVLPTVRPRVLSLPLTVTFSSKVTVKSSCAPAT